MYSYGAGPSREGREGRPYQGYPYVNPMVIDVETIDAETAAKWSALPRRPGILYEQPGSSRQEPGTSARNPATVSPKDQNSGETSDEIDYDENPVVYIEVPESSGSEVVEQRRPPVEDSFVEQTIFYDQFKDRTVVTVSDDSRSYGSGSISSASSSRSRPPRPPPPSSLSLRSPDSGYLSPSRIAPGVPPIMSKETSIYGGYQNDGFSNQDLAMRDFPNPPPAYSEFDTVTPTSPITQQPVRTPPAVNSPQTTAAPSPVVLNPANLPPRTQVIVPPIDSDNMIVFCKYCGVNSPSFMIKQVGLATHILALILFLLGLIPCTILLYYSNFCRYKNHYCKQCNNLMAYEIPFLGKDLTYAT